MASAKRAWISWSSGKDSAWALHIISQDPAYDVCGLFCTINKAAERVAMHAVRVALLRQQAAAIGLPLQIIELPFPCSDEEYAIVMQAFVDNAVTAGIDAFLFGDLFLEDVRQYRIDRLAGTGIEAVFPIWGQETGQLARDMIAGGQQAVLTCVDPAQLDPSFAGRPYDEQLLADLPDGVDPCGENGEFHTFVHASPCFSEALPVQVAEAVERDGFVFADVLPGAVSDASA